MGRRLSEDGRTTVIADVSTRLAPVLAAAAKAPKVDVRIVAALLGSALADIARPVSPAGSGADAILFDATLFDAAQDLITVQAPAAAPEALTAWITRYFAPTSRRQLPGAAALWTRAVNLQRDRQRRGKTRSIAGCPTRVTLSTRHRELLAKQVRQGGELPAGALIGKLIERHYGRVTGKKQQPAAPQAALDL
jgi:hypothetical protein